MTVQSPLRVVVDTCIACGSRSREGACVDGCDDVALDLVDVGDVEVVAARLVALRTRVVALTDAAGALDGPLWWSAVVAGARTALGVPIPRATEVHVTRAWGCPACGRVSAPQPCLEVCVRGPVLMTDAAQLEPLLAETTLLEALDRELTSLLELLTRVIPRPGTEARNRAALAERAAGLLMRHAR